ncbi:LysM peptidoglycan-binding domain-containing protein [Neobacillus notoginsengisoli]|uniref:LysM peptidoglycan-binding domain-containing protein n=1 Tax=Neobacillus notoginsengisoli TaxID=1578198 RepID=A0A417YZ18_9BACI|nr:LysM peptidoglycan-binding domain-containing protein [Neobacillus notoginsengisoli]RHW42760.1 LysM peptidoglycan-binding domain-containing protein [Neobacillus notoginsengisoli]
MAVHVVAAGENLWSISKRYNVSLGTLVTVNGLVSTTEIVPGLALYIPDPSLPTRSYRVKAGDVLWKIAQRFSSTIPLIAAANPGLNIDQLRIGQVLAVPSPTKMTIQTLGFFVPTGTAADLMTIDSLANQLTYVAVVNYSFTAQGFAFAQMDDAAIITRCRQLNIVPLLMIRNFTSSGFSAELAGQVLENPTFRQNLVTSLVNLTVSRGFGGVSLDLEFIPPARRRDFNLFLQVLKQQLGTLILNVNVHAKTADLPTNRIVGAYDYASIGNTADLMAVMTIDYGYPGGPPDPVSPIWWIEQVITYARTLVNPRKLMMAMPLYGYDKVVTTNATKGLSVLAAQNQAISKGSSIQYDNIAKSPWYRYWTGAEEHIVWYEDIRSFIEKYQLLDRNNLAGTTYWQIGLPAPQNWEFLKTEVIVE